MTENNAQTNTQEPTEETQGLIAFKLDDVSVQLDSWAKHHKQYGLRFKREYPDGNKPNVEPKPEHTEVLAAIKKYPERVVQQPLQYYDREAGDLKPAIDYHLLLDNQDYPETNVPDYGVGSMNTTHTTKLRLHFKCESVDVILEHQYETGGSFATSFHSLLSSMSGVEDILDEIVENSNGLEKTGIEDGKKHDDESELQVLGIDQYKRPIDFGIEKNEFLDSLIGIEVYQHDTVIHEHTVE